MHLGGAAPAQAATGAAYRAVTYSSLPQLNDGYQPKAFPHVGHDLPVFAVPEQQTMMPLEALIAACSVLMIAGWHRARPSPPFRFDRDAIG